MSVIRKLIGFKSPHSMQWAPGELETVERQFVSPVPIIYRRIDAHGNEGHQPGGSVVKLWVDDLQVFGLMELTPELEALDNHGDLTLLPQFQWFLAGHRVNGLKLLGMKAMDSQWYNRGGG